MPTLRLLVAMSGCAQAWATGDLYECDEVAAARLVAAGYGVRVDPPLAPAASAVETAMAAGAPERAVRPRGKARR